MMVLAGFSLEDNLGRDRFFKETSCWLTPAWRWSLECFSFPSPMRTWVCRELAWRSYIMQRPCLLVAIRRVGIGDRKEFAAAAVVQEGERARANAKPPQLFHELRWYLYLWMRLLLFIISTLLPLS